MTLLKLFCNVDDFWQAFQPHWRRVTPARDGGRRVRATWLSPSEIMTILIHFHQSHYRTFKACYTEYVLVCPGMSWYVLVCSGMSWYVLVCPGMSWYVLVCSGMFWYVLVCSGMSWYVLVCSGMFWYVLVCSGMSWYVLVCLGMSWYVLVCPDSPPTRIPRSGQLQPVRWIDPCGDHPTGSLPATAPRQLHRHRLCGCHHHQGMS